MAGILFVLVVTAILVLLTVWAVLRDAVRAGDGQDGIDG